MKIATLQYGPVIGRVEENIRRAGALLEEAEGSGRLNGLHLLVLPELAFAGYNFPDLAAIKPYLEYTCAGVTAQWAFRTAARLNCLVSMGYAEKSYDASIIPSKVYMDSTSLDNGTSTPQNFNSTLTVDPAGKVVAHYRKTHLYYTDATWASRSPTGFLTTSLHLPGDISSGIQTSFGICMDINPDRFTAPWTAYELANHTLSSKSQLLCISTAWLTHQSREELSTGVTMPDIDTLSYWVERLKPLLENDAPTVVVMANRTGIEVGEMRVHSLEDPPSSAVSREKDEKDSSGATEAGPPTQRVLVSFRGRQADITGLGIDLEYINALPDELREELIMRRIFEEQSKAVVADEKKAIEKLPGSEPVVADEVQGGTVENALLGEEARYAGTSVIMGLGGGEIKVWGMLGKAEEGVLVIDTSSPPKSVMAFQKNGEED